MLLKFNVLSSSLMGANTNRITFAHPVCKVIRHKHFDFFEYLVGLHFMIERRETVLRVKNKDKRIEIYMEILSENIKYTLRFLFVDSKLAEQHIYSDQGLHCVAMNMSGLALASVDGVINWFSRQLVTDRFITESMSRLYWSKSHPMHKKILKALQDWDLCCDFDFDHEGSQLTMMCKIPGSDDYIRLYPHQESGGIRHIMHLLGAAIFGMQEAQENGYIFAIPTFNEGLHPMLCEEILEYCQREYNPASGYQLIAGIL